jgi:hypothetical protein
MKKIALIFLLCAIGGCTQQPRMTAWEHLQAALELDEASVLEYMALDHLPEIIAYDNTGALREAIYVNPDAATEWLLLNYRERIIDAVAADPPRELIPVFIQRHGDIFLDQLHRSNPEIIAAVAAQNDPYTTFDKVYQRDPSGILRRAIDQNPRYAAQYLRNYYGELQ